MYKICKLGIKQQQQQNQRNSPSKSFCGSQFISLTFSGTLSGISPVYRHRT